MTNIGKRFNGLGRRQMGLLVAIYHNGAWDSRKRPILTAGTLLKTLGVLDRLVMRDLLLRSFPEHGELRYEVTDQGRHVARQAREWLEGGYSVRPL